MSGESSHWPQYASPLEALTVEVDRWSDIRYERTEGNYANLQGELPKDLGCVAVGIVDVNELPENYSMLRVYRELPFRPEAFGALMLVNFQGERPPEHAQKLIDTIHNQADEAQIPTAVSVVGYSAGERRLDDMRSDAWDIPMMHAVRNGIPHPIIGISNDADMSAASPDYLQLMTRNPYVGRRATVWGSAVVFDQPGGSHLPLNRYIAYLNQGRYTVCELLGAPLMYGASMGLTLETYAIADTWGGPDHDLFNPDAEPNPYGLSEPSRLVLNVWEQLTGMSGSMSDTVPAFVNCARRVDGWVKVSPRREIFGMATGSRDFDHTAQLLNTKDDNPCRRLTRQQIASLAGSIPFVDAPICETMRELDNYWLDLVRGTPELEIMKEVLRAARSGLNLPPPDFDK